jgi:uncharacterized protein
MQPPHQTEFDAIMQFLVIAYDGKDPEAPARRQQARPAHLERAATAHAEGKMLAAGALLDDNDQMIGSALMMEFPSEAELRDWMAADPYTTGDVWREVKITRFRMAKH